MIAKQFKKSLCRRNSHAYTCAVEFEGNVQEVGYRLKAWTIALGHETLQKGKLENADGNLMRVYLASKNIQELEHAYNELCKPENIPKSAEVVAVRQIDANGVKTLPADRVTDILMLEQQSKGVDYLKAILEKLGGTNKGMDGLGRGMDGLSRGMDGLGRGMDGVNKKLDELPDRIADKLGNRFDDLGKKFDEIPDKIGKKLDELPEKIARAIKTA